METIEANRARRIWLAAAAVFVLVAGLAAVAIVELRSGPASAGRASPMALGSAAMQSQAQGDDAPWLERARHKQVRAATLGDPRAGAAPQTPLTQAWSNALGKRDGTAPAAQVAPGVKVARPDVEGPRPRDRGSDAPATQPH